MAILTLRPETYSTEQFLIFVGPFARLTIKSEAELLLEKPNRIITETKEKQCINTARCAFPIPFPTPSYEQKQ